MIRIDSMHPRSAVRRRPADFPLPPVVLVHGWKSHPGVWKTMRRHLEDDSRDCWVFSYAGMGSATTKRIAAALREFIRERRRETGYAGTVDLVCHCMGTCISRYLLEILDGDAREESVRQIIGLGPPHNGSSIAELICHPEFGPDITERLEGVFFPRGYDPVEDPVVQEYRIESPVVRELAAAPRRSDITYRTLCTANRTRDPAFFPWFDGRTWQYTRTGGWVPTLAGDGIVPHTDSRMPGAHTEVLPADPASMTARPDTYCHFMLPKNPEIIRRVAHHLRDTP